MKTKFLVREGTNYWGRHAWMVKEVCENCQHVKRDVGHFEVKQDAEKFRDLKNAARKA